MNRTEQPISFSLDTPDSTGVTTIPPRAIATYVIST